MRQSRDGLSVSRARAGGSAAQIGLANGDLILQAGGDEVATEDGFSHAVMLAFQRGSLPLIVQRGRRAYSIALPIKRDGA